MTTYPKILQEILVICKKFREKNIAIADFHQAIYQAEQTIVSLEDKDLRHFFMLMENEIDSIRVMNNEPDFLYDSKAKETDISLQILPIVEKVEKECKKRLSDQ